nr:MAG TPA: Protein of unknown function (DUF1056) [Caudoviricetes sp.]
MRLLNHIHTILLLIGLGFLIYGFFLLNEVAGFLCSGVILILLALYISKTKG